MGDPKEFRARASKLFAFALNARELGTEGYAMALTKLANDALAAAEEMERRASPPYQGRQPRTPLGTLTQKRIQRLRRA